ncbi:MAG: hypothetical protein J5606_07210, partial [Bacteroidales bacterium]|nr:hypothetical protein [Bacteroidales bacterium]
DKIGLDGVNAELAEKGLPQDAIGCRILAEKMANSTISRNRNICPKIALSVCIYMVAAIFLLFVSC